MNIEIVPILSVLGGAVLLLAAARLARGMSLPEGLGSGVALWLAAMAAILVFNRRPAWLTAGVTEDRLLTYARMVGLTGMLFVAGTRFDLRDLRGKADYLLRIGLCGAVLFTGVILGIKFFAHQDSGSVVLLAATVIASSVWYPTETTAAASKSASGWLNDWQLGAIVLSAMAVGAVYFFDIFHALPQRRVSSSAYLVVALYESLKLVLLFASGYFICTRFLARAAGRISTARTTIGFALIAILVFVLSLIVTNQLAAIGWAFLAGALWRSTNPGADFGKTEKPIGSALLLSLAFLSPLLQVHGRSLSGVGMLPIFLFIAVLLKAVLIGFATRVRGRTPLENTKLATVIALPGEAAILLLGFGVTRWPIDSSVYFTLLGYALVSTLAIPVASWLSTRKAKPAVRLRSNAMRRTVKVVVGLLIFSGAIASFTSSTVLAQQPATNQNVQLGRGMSVLAPGLIEIGSKTNLFLNLADKIPLTAEQKKKLEDLVFEVQMFSFQKDTDLDVADAELRRLLTRDNIDLAAVRAKLKEIGSIRGEADMKKIETLLKAIGLLTHEQHIRIILLAREPESTKPAAQTY